MTEKSVDVPRDCSHLCAIMKLVCPFIKRFIKLLYLRTKELQAKWTDGRIYKTGLWH